MPDRILYDRYLLLRGALGIPAHLAHSIAKESLALCPGPFAFAHAAARLQTMLHQHLVHNIPKEELTHEPI